MFIGGWLEIYRYALVGNFTVLIYSIWKIS